MTLTLPPRQAVDTPQEFWFSRPGHDDPIQEVVSIKRAEELVAKGWTLLAVGPLDAPAPQAEFYVEPETGAFRAENVAAFANKPAPMSEFDDASAFAPGRQE